MSTTLPATELDADIAGSGDLIPVPKLVGVVGEFANATELLHAAEQVRDAGFTRWDTHTPFPVHGIDTAMGVRRTILPWIVLGGGLTGFVTALAMQFWMNGSELAADVVDWPASGYPYKISGKPLFSLPANIPIAFELTVLLAAFGAFFGMLVLNRLYRLYNPIFQLDRFRRVTTDRFYLTIDANDPKFSSEQSTALLNGLSATGVEEIWDTASRQLPSFIAPLGLILLTIALVPPVLVMRSRSVTSSVERMHPIQDMDFQAKFKPQQRNAFFADGRAMRPNVEGTVSRGAVPGNTPYLRGVEPGQALASLQDKPAAGQAPAADGAPAEGGKPAGETPPPPAAGMNENQNWVQTVPIPATATLMDRGRQQFGIYCAPCHGLAGYGDGLVNQRAINLKAATWVPVPSLHTAATRNRADGYIFGAITEGVRKMPAYGSQIDPQDRWAIVLYVRALQRSQGAPER